jgi:hypothetical protein
VEHVVKARDARFQFRHLIIQGTPVHGRAP